MKNSKIEYKGKAKIIRQNNNIIVRKKKNKDLNSLFDYLNSRNINSHPNILNEKDDYIEYEYFYEKNNSDEYKNIGKTIGQIHVSTIENKKVSKRKHKDIYEMLIDNIDNVKEEYDSLIRKIENETYMSPKSYYLARNYTPILHSLNKSEKYLNNWYNLVKDKEEERVVIVHNNLKKDNIHKTNEVILTGWDNYVIDSPVLDLYKLYKNEYKEMDIIKVIKDYEMINPLTKEEKLLLQALINIVPKIEIDDKEIKSIKNIKEILFYIKKTNELKKSGVLK